MELSKTYEKFTKCLADLSGSAEPLDSLLLIESFSDAFKPHRNENDSDKKFCIEISDGQESFSIVIDMSNEEQPIRSCSIKRN